LPWGVSELGAIVLAGAASGIVAYLFIRLTHAIKDTGNKVFRTRLWLMPVAGGVLVIALALMLNTTDYLGLGVTSPGGISIVNAFHPGGVGRWSWFLKLVFTAITIGSGFKGGEVTPLFFIGATLGAAIAAMLGVPTDLLAGICFLAVFAGAANAPVACTIMGLELFGPTHIVYFAIACFVAYYCSGKQSIYRKHAVMAKEGKE
jgi:H+/Cl- antiporter ClcA